MADIGLVQWTPKSSLIQHASILGQSNYDDGDVQLYVIANEMTGNPSSILEWYSSQAFVSRYYNSGATSDMIGISGADFLANSMGWSADKLAVMFMVGYERPSYSPSVNHVDQRMANALYWFNYMGGYIPPEPPTPPPVEETTKRKGFPWAVMTRKIRKENDGYKTKNRISV